MFSPPYERGSICPWRCHMIGGPWISSNPSCPFHGYDRIPTSEDDCTVYLIDPEEGERLCQEEEARFQEEERRWAESRSDGEESQ